MPIGQAVAWLQAHHPRGLRPDGSASSSGPAEAMLTGYSYAGRSSRAWESADLEVEVAQAGGASVLRADAVLVWLDPVPLPDSGGGRRVHVGVAGRCPATDKAIAGVTNRGADLRRRLLPTGVPTAGLECRYYGSNGRPFRLRVQLRLAAVAATRVARSMQRVSLSHTVGGVTSCPMDDGAAEIIALSYAGGPAVDLWVKLNGCRLVANGFIEAGLY
jgi:hypothetical protein